jgi:hypothetical protein
MKRITEVWSNSSEQTCPPRLQGETMIRLLQLGGCLL